MSAPIFTRRQIQEALTFAERVERIGQAILDAEPEPKTPEPVADPGMAEEIEALEDARELDAHLVELRELVFDAQRRIDELRRWLAAPAAFGVRS